MSDTTVTGQNVGREIRRDAAAFKDRVQFSYWDALGMEDLLGRLRSLSGDTVVLFSFFFRDSNGDFFEYDESAKRITDASPVPVFGLWEFNLGFGIVGGKLVSGYEQGRIAGGMALRVIDGENISTSPLQLQSPNRYAFDFRELKKFAIKSSLLPPGSRVINREISINEKYKVVLWSVFAAFITLAVLTVFLLNSIRKQHKIEKKLRHSEQRMAEIIDFLPDPTFVIDSEGKVFAWNRAIEELTGRQAKEMLGKGEYEYALPFYGVRRPVMIDLVSTWDDDISKQYRNIEKVGERLISESEEPNERLGNRHFRNVAGPLYDHEGNVAGAIETLHDMTHRRKTEQDAQTLYNETQKNLAFIKAMLSAIPSPVYFKDNNLRFLGCNQAYSDMQGLAEEEIVGKTVYDIYPVERADIYYAKDMALLQNPGRQEYETEVLDKSGAVREVFFAKDTFFDHHGNVAGIVGSFMDISELKNAEKEKTA